MSTFNIRYRRAMDVLLQRIKHTFTLIELMAVIAVIAILITLLLPALSRAKDMGRRTLCASNLKQVGSGFFLYAQDWSEYLPRAWDGNNSTLWGITIIDYIGKKTVLSCPSDSVHMSIQRSNSIYWWNYLQYSYGCNWTYDSVAGTRLFTEVIWKNRLNKIPKISSTILAGDSLKSALMARGDDITNYWAIGNRHGGSANMLFADCHVACFKQVELFYSNLWYMH